MAINENWNIRSRSHACSETGVTFADGDHFYTALFFGESDEEGFVRKDYAEDAWNDARRKLETPPFSFWRTTYTAPPPPDAPVVEKETAETLLRRLVEENNSESENARYVLAVMLERDKKLKQIDTQETDSGKFLIYENRENGEVMLIRDPHLHLDAIESVQEEVIKLLGGGEDGSASADEPSPKASPPEEATAEVDGGPEGSA